MYTIFFDQITGLEYIRPSKELYIKGLVVLLKGFGHHVFFNFNQVMDSEEKYYQSISKDLNGVGTKSISILLKSKQETEGKTNLNRHENLKNKEN